MALIKRTLLRSRPQELGKIKIGGKGAEREKKGRPGETFQMPVKFDHFVITTRTRGADGNYLRDERIHSHPKVGEKPMELDGILMYAEVADNFHSQMVQYKGRRQVVACDGEQMIDMVSGVEKRCPRADGGDCSCKPYARLHLQLLASPYTAGYHVYRTTSWETANNIQTALEEIHAMFGTLFRAPVRLILYPAEDSYVEKGEEKTSKSFKVGLVLAMSMEEAGGMMVAANRSLHATREALKITAGAVLADLDESDKAEADDIADEFFPPEASTQTSELTDALRQAGQKAVPVVVEADFEVEDGEQAAPKPPAKPERQASKGMLSQVESLLGKARESKVLTLEMEDTARRALETGGETLVNEALSILSMALIKKRAADEPKPEQGSLLDGGKS